MSETLTGFEGVYNWSYSGGGFVVELRPYGSFYCKSYPASASWSLVGNVITVDWKKYGKYELEVNQLHNPHDIASACGGHII